MVWLKKPKEEFVLLSLNEPKYMPERTELGQQLIGEMLEQGSFPERVQDVEIVETEAIEFQNPGQQSSDRRGP